MGRDALLCQFSGIAMCAHEYVWMGPETSASMADSLFSSSTPPLFLSLSHPVEPWKQPGREVGREERMDEWMGGWVDRMGGWVGGWMVCM
jgi:hypothetical protein